MEIRNKEMQYLIDCLLNDERIPDSPDFTEKEWAALCEEAEISEEIYDSCLQRCHNDNNGVMFISIVNQFPQYNPKYSKEIIEKHKRQWEKEKKEYIAKYGTEYFFD